VLVKQQSIPSTQKQQNQKEARWFITPIGQSTVDTPEITLVKVALSALPLFGEWNVMLTWGDGVTNLNLRDLLAFSSLSWQISVNTVRLARFGHLELDGNQMIEFSEKPQTRGWINGAFCLRNHKCSITSIAMTHSREPLERLSERKGVMAYRLTLSGNAWMQCEIKKSLESVWGSNAPWGKTWGGKAPVVTGHKGYIGQ